MQYGSEKNRWYALFVVTGEEEKVKKRLEYTFSGGNLRVIVPRRRLKERKNGKWEYKVRTLFPGYVLLNGCIKDEYYPLKNVPGVIKLLKDKNGPLVIEESEIALINRLICNNEVIGCSSVYMEGGSIVVIDGPLLGMEGMIETIDRRKGRAKVRLNLMGEARSVELSISMVQPA